MKTIVIGSGVAGLTAALTLLRDGQEVEVFEQAAVPGGVTRGLEQDGLPLGLRPAERRRACRSTDEPVGKVLGELGVLDKMKVLPEDREYIFPDFELRAPKEYADPKWRIEELKRLFPEEQRGLERYWKDSIRFTRLVTLGGRLESGGFWAKIAVLRGAAAAAAHGQVDGGADCWTATSSREKLKAVFVSILADFFTPPSQFQGLGVFALNSEKAYDERIPAQLARNAEVLGLYTIAGGTRALTDAYMQEIPQAGRGAAPQLRGEED